ncbi:Glutaminyl-tRNA synthetase [Taxawa tesnikishii (nom. ined.)]|nr:Glutaminyl-tRNA synthetase [Dothideales sp. JES 119]
MADAAPAAVPGEEPKISKRAAEKAAKKAEAAAKKAAAKAAAASQPKAEGKPTAKPAAAPAPPADPSASFKQGWLKGVYNEKPVKEVHTRFPPEPNGYLHIGHAKAITVNFGFAKAYGGVCNLRFDDTNPAKEEERYFTSIKEMVSWLGFSPHKITYSSDDFDQLYELAEELIRRDKAYVCHCTAEEVNKGRGGPEHGPRSVCKHWNRKPEESLEEFRAMRDGKYKAGEAVLRMKMYLGTKPEEYEITETDSEEIKKEKARLKAFADNPSMWDVAAYRVKNENYHHRTGYKWRVYPTYEFTHCLVDSFEGITHSLCTVEFESLRPAYNWLLESLDHKIPGSEEKGPMQREYGRLNVEGTILSKRRIQMLVQGATIGSKAATEDAEDLAGEVEEIKLEETGDADVEENAATFKATPGSGKTLPPVVRDWNDPRLFTLVALRRRGVPPGALKKFVLDLGVTKANADTKMHILDASVRTYLERTVPRLMLVLDPIKVVIDNLPSDHIEEREVPFDPKDPAKGTHKIPFTSTIYIDRDDFREVDDPDFFRLAPGKSVGLLNVQHPLRAKSFSKDESGKVVEIHAEYGADLPAGKARIHWIGESAAHKSPVKAECRIFNPLFKNPRPNELDWKNGGYFDDINPDSEIVYKDAMVECGFEEVRRRAPWPKEEGEAEGTSGNYSVRFQGLRTAFFALDKEATEDKVILNRIVSLKEDTGKR